MFDPSQLTIVIQGRIGAYTYKSLVSILKNFKDLNKIIVSTWNCDSEYASYLRTLSPNKIQVISSMDPGAELMRKTPLELNNTNRILVSSINGLDRVETKYAIVCRSDLVFNSSEILNLYSKYNNYSNKLLVLSHTTIDVERDFCLPFHCCDWLHLGETSSLRQYFDIELMPLDEISWYDRHEKPENRIDPGNLSKFMAEDYITSNGLRNLGYVIQHDYYCHSSKEILQQWHSILGDKFIVVGCRQAGILNLKYPISSFIGNSKSLTFAKWKRYAGYNVNCFERLYDSLVYINLKIIYSLRRRFKAFKKILLYRP